VFHEFSEYPFDVGSVPLDVLCLRFLHATLSVDGHIVHMDCEPFLSDFFGEYGIHHCLKSGWGVGESEEHDCWFEQAFIGNESSFPFISFFDPDVVVAPSDVKFGVEGAAAQAVNEFWNEWKWVCVADGPLIDGSIVLYWSKFSVLLFDVKEVAFVGTF
jgi:hypothetical protein